ncbi:hypothetical protein [Paracidovorax anthurii]
MGAYGLASLITGLLLTPLSYIAVGVLGDFSPAFSLVLVPPLLASVLFLLHQLLSGASGTKTPTTRIIAAVASWGFVLFFTAIVSGARLQVGWGRLGGFCMLWLICSALALPVLALGLRNASLVRFTAGWRHSPRAFILFLAMAMGMAIHYLVTPQRFP